MTIWAISDLHLSFEADKPMDKFGPAWTDHSNKILKAWKKNIASHDSVIIPGDISWGKNWNQAKSDIGWIHSLPGKKILIKGNHDYWWDTLKKMKKRLPDSMSILHRNSYIIENSAIVGARGWLCPSSPYWKKETDEKIYHREAERLKASFQNLRNSSIKCKRIIACMHFPPFESLNAPSLFLDTLFHEMPDILIYGHLHGQSLNDAVEGNVNGIEFKCVSADHLRFSPLKL